MASLAGLVHEGVELATLRTGADLAPVPMAALLEAGSRRFDTGSTTSAVAVLMTNDRPTVELVLGAIACGATLVSLPLPGRGADLDAYGTFVHEVCTVHDAGEVVARDDVAELLAGVGFAVRPHSRIDAGPPLPVGDGAGFRLVQFSSGSTSMPKPIVLDDAALGANVDAILHRVKPRPGDVAVSWLPLSHDMGLIGMLLTSIAGISPRWAGRSDLVLLDPTTFLRRPVTWLEALSEHRGTFTAAPDFGYRMAAQARGTAGLDMSSLRCAIVGGEVTRAETLHTLVDALAPAGLRATALCPAYGLAEMGLAVTLTSPAAPWDTRRFSTRALADDRRSAPAGGEAATTLVSSGPVLAGYAVDCGAGHDGPSGAIGRISVRGPSAGVDGVTGICFGDPDGWYETGDMGFCDDGQLYVCGRADDYLVAHGRNVYAPAVETAVAGVDGIRPGRVTAVGLPDGSWCIVAEPVADDHRGIEAQHLRNEVRRAAVQVTSARPDDVMIVRRGSLPLTSSGKLQRNEVRRRLLQGDMQEG